MRSHPRALLFATTALIALTSSALAAPMAPRPATGDTGIVVAAYSATVYNIQQLLNARGYDAGPTDGLMGARTRAAIEAYQRANGLLATGQPSESLLAHIRASETAAAPAAESSEFSQRDILQLQRRLNRLGYATPMTGAVDSQTRAAIRDYERDNNLLVTGAANEALAEHVYRAALERRDQRQADADTVDPDTVARIQHGLRARGYTVNNTDGQMDWSTREAIRSYQRDRGVAVTGEPSTDLAAQLAEGLTPAASSPENIRAVQQALNQRGYNAGPADGVMGPSTRSAIRNYRQRAGLPGSDGVDRELLVSLGLAEAETKATANTAKPTPVTVVRDDFDDGDYSANPRWQVLSKSFTVVDGELRSSVPLETASGDVDVGKAVVRGVLSQVLGLPTQQQSNAAVIAHSASFGAIFDLKTRIRYTGQGPAKFHLGPYQGSNAVAGFRVVYESQASQPLSIASVADSGARVLASTGQTPNIADGEWHELRFSRDEDGRLSVEIDGAEVLSARYTDVASGHAGVSFANFGGDWSVDRIEMTAPPAG